MNYRSLVAVAAALSAASIWAQSPGNPEDNGVTPITATFYVNTPDTILNLANRTESIGIGITRNSNVIIGWENDGDALTDLEAVWTLYSRDGVQLTPDTEQTSLNPQYAGQSVTSKFLSFFRGNNAIPGRTSWGPKIKANPFGDGIGMGATAFDLGVEIADLTATQNDANGENAGDFPAVQLLGNGGEPLGIVSGVPAEYAERAGNIRIADWDYLSTGNIVVAGESRQSADLVDIYGGDAPQNHAIIRIVNRTNGEVNAVQLASSEATKAEMWHGLGVTKNGFAVRFAGADGRAKVRFFDNTGKVLGVDTNNIDLATRSGSEIMAAGGRGDGVGFHGNGNDAYAAVATGTDGEGKRQVWVTVLNADGTLRWSKSVSDDLTLNGPSRCDVAIDSLGRVAVVYADSVASAGVQPLVLARLFNAAGTAIGKTFRVSETETTETAVAASADPRVAFRNDIIAINWVSRNSGLFDPVENARGGIVAARFFVVPVKPGSIESAGLTRIKADTVVINQGMDKLGNWEPYASVLGTSTFLIEGNAFAEGTSDKQRYVVALQPVTGGAGKTVEAFYADNGTPYNGEINASRQNGNPGRVAGDPRPGAVNYMVGGEASPHVYEPFNSGDRWNTGFDRLADGRYGTVQTFSLNTATSVPTPLHKALDASNGRLTSGAAPGNQITRFGGDIVVLENGNFLVVTEDRSLVRNPAGNAAVATIFKPDGAVVKESFLVANGDLWANVAATKGGFVVRVAGNLYFYNTAGDLQGSAVPQNTSGESYDGGRGDGTRLASHINSPYVFLAGKVTTAPIVRVSAWDTRTRAFVTVTDVSEGGFRGDFDRATVAVDSLSRLVVSWVAKPDGYEQQQVAARVLAFDEATKTIKPLTPSFLPFVNAAPVGNIRSLQMSVAMTTKQILIAAKGEINLANKPELGADSPSEINFYTVISHPNPQEDPLSVSVLTDPIRLSNITDNGATVSVQWTGGTAPFKVQRRAALGAGGWIDVETRNDRTATLTKEGDAGFIRITQ